MATVSAEPARTASAPSSAPGAPRSGCAPERSGPWFADRVERWFPDAFTLADHPPVVPA